MLGPAAPDRALDDQRRRYYRITDYGRRVLGAEVRRPDALVGVAREKRLLGGFPQGLPEGT